MKMYILHEGTKSIHVISSVFGHGFDPVLLQCADEEF